MIIVNSEKSKCEELKEKLLIKKKNGTLKMSEQDVTNADEFCEPYKEFLNKAKTEREFIKRTIELAKEKGFEEYNCENKYKPGDKIYYINRGKSLVLTVIGRKGCKDGIKMAAAHVDSPRIDIKPRPLYESNDLAFLKTHYYGGIKKYQWTTIPLALHGKVIKKDGTNLNVVLGESEDEPCFCITDLLPHLAKEQMNKTMLKGFTGEDLNILIGSRPFRSDEGSELVKLNIMKILNEKYGIIESDFLSAELEMVPAFKSRDIGFDKSMIGAYGHDDKVCAYTAVMAILDCESPEQTVMTILADKEEIGSDGNTGMKSAFFRYFIADIANQEGIKGRHVLTKSKCLSADVNAAFDPTYATVYEPMNSCYINNGVVITKYTGSGGKYDTSDASAEFMFEIRRMLEDANIVWQTGELGKVDGGGGGTVAKFIANLNVDVVDLGVPVLSMHAPFEIVSKSDVYMAYKTFRKFFES